MARSTPMDMWRARRSALVARLIGETRTRPDLMEHLLEGWPELHAVLVELDEHDQATPPVDGPAS